MAEDKNDINVVEKIKDYLTRLSDGESLESVRADFVENFQSVEATEIARAEQELIQAGAPISEVQKICDVHSALFHGVTKEEQMKQASQAKCDSLNCEKDDTALPQGHPVSIFIAENEKFVKIINEIKADLESDVTTEKLLEKLEDLRFVSHHYAQKGDLIYPLLDKSYGFSGPSNVMWGVDDEIRDEMKALAKKGDSLSDFRSRLKDVVVRAEEMVYKENNILFPMCLKKFSEVDWMRIYYEMRAYETILPSGYPTWEAAEACRSELKTRGGKLAREIEQQDDDFTDLNGYITLGSGMMTQRQIEAVLNTIPMELTFVDDENINRYFDQGEKLFKRPDMAIGRDVFSCHPPKIAKTAKRIIEEFRAGNKDTVEIWMQKNNKPVFVTYMAVRDEDGTYLGVLECVQKMDFAKKYFEASKEK